MTERFVDIACKVLGHDWVERVYHAVHPQRFDVCLRCGEIRVVERERVS